MKLIHSGRQLLFRGLLFFLIFITLTGLRADARHRQKADLFESVPQEQRARFKVRLADYIRFLEQGKIEQLFELFSEETKKLSEEKSREEAYKEMRENLIKIELSEIKVDRVTLRGENRYMVTCKAKIKEKEGTQSTTSMDEIYIVAVFEHEDWFFSPFILTRMQL
ncbi:MAG TPA: hypothetical protein VFC63_24675 [Blastocatellia bacterium]|nr:hypothetical protein [Blastocatellia bacterium]